MKPEMTTHLQPGPDIGFHPERHKVCHTMIDTIDVRYLASKVEFCPHKDRPDMPWVAIIVNPQENVTSGVFQTEVRAKLWCMRMADALTDYEFVTVKLLTDLESEIKDDFDLKGEVK